MANAAELETKETKPAPVKPTTGQTTTTAPVKATKSAGGDGGGGGAAGPGAAMDKPDPKGPKTLLGKVADIIIRYADGNADMSKLGQQIVSFIDNPGATFEKIAIKQREKKEARKADKEEKKAASASAAEKVLVLQSQIDDCQADIVELWGKIVEIPWRQQFPFDMLSPVPLQQTEGFEEVVALYAQIEAKTKELETLKTQLQTAKKTEGEAVFTQELGKVGKSIYDGIYDALTPDKIDSYAKSGVDSAFKGFSSGLTELAAKEANPEQVKKQAEELSKALKVEVDALVTKILASDTGKAIKEWAQKQATDIRPDDIYAIVYCILWTACLLLVATKIDVDLEGTLATKLGKNWSIKAKFDLGTVRDITFEALKLDVGYENKAKTFGFTVSGGGSKEGAASAGASVTAQVNLDLKVGAEGSYEKKAEGDESIAGKFSMTYQDVSNIQTAYTRANTDFGGKFDGGATVKALVGGMSGSLDAVVAAFGEAKAAMGLPSPDMTKIESAKAAAKTMASEFSTALDGKVCTKIGEVLATDEGKSFDKFVGKNVGGTTAEDLLYLIYWSKAVSAAKSADFRQDAIREIVVTELAGDSRFTSVAAKAGYDVSGLKLVAAAPGDKWEVAANVSSTTTAAGETTTTGGASVTYTGQNGDKGSLGVTASDTPTATEGTVTGAYSDKDKTKTAALTGSVKDDKVTGETSVKALATTALTLGEIMYKGQMSVLDEDVLFTLQAGDAKAMKLGPSLSQVLEKDKGVVTTITINEDGKDHPVGATVTYAENGDFKVTIKKKELFAFGGPGNQLTVGGNMTAGQTGDKQEMSGGLDAKYTMGGLTTQAAGAWGMGQLPSYKFGLDYKDDEGPNKTDWNLGAGFTGGTLTSAQGGLTNTSDNDYFRFGAGYKKDLKAGNESVKGSVLYQQGNWGGGMTGSATWGKDPTALDLTGFGTRKLNSKLDLVGSLGYQHTAGTGQNFSVGGGVMLNKNIMGTFNLNVFDGFTPGDNTKVGAGLKLIVLFP